ncbi:MAG: phytanoyl-CoA dioxygenase family protein [Bacteroidota bacterium]
MNYQEYAKQFWKEGYLVIENFFDNALMDHLNEIILQHYGMNPEWEHSNEFLEKAATEVVPWFPFRTGDTHFQPIEEDERLNALTEAILGMDWQSLYLMVMFSKQGTKGQAWHQDSPPEEEHKFNLNRLFYTHDITDEIGGKTLVVPGSHKEGVLPSGDPHGMIKNQVVLSPKKGTLVILHGHTWHSVLPIKGTYRVSANARAIPKDTPEDITDIAVYRNMRYRFSTSEVIEER